MTKKLKIEEKAPEYDLRSYQVRILTCKIVVLLRACAFGSHFLGNGVTNASKDGRCLCVCCTEGTSEQKATYQRFIMEKKG